METHIRSKASKVFLVCKHPGVLLPETRIQAKHGESIRGFGKVGDRDIFDLQLIRTVAEKVAENGWLLKSNLWC